MIELTKISCQIVIAKIQYYPLSETETQMKPYSYSFHILLHRA